VPASGSCRWTRRRSTTRCWNCSTSSAATSRSYTAGKLDALAEASSGFSAKFPEISFEEGLKIMGPIKIRENRPV